MTSSIKPLLPIFQALAFNMQAQVKRQEPSRAVYRPNPERFQQCKVFSNGVQVVQKPRSQKIFSSKKGRSYDSSDQQEQYLQAKAYESRKFKKAKQSDPDFSVKNQKKDRNVVSNIIHHFFRYVRQAKTLEQIEKIIVHHNMQITIEQFLISFQAFSLQFKTYITEKHLKNLWNNQEPRFKDTCLVLRILSRKFLSKDCFLSIYYANKLSKSSKMIHYKGKRDLLKQLLRLKNKIK